MGADVDAAAAERARSSDRRRSTAPAAQADHVTRRSSVDIAVAHQAHACGRRATGSRNVVGVVPTSRPSTSTRAPAASTARARARWSSRARPRGSGRRSLRGRAAAVRSAARARVHAARLAALATERLAPTAAGAAVPSAAAGAGRRCRCDAPVARWSVDTAAAVACTADTDASVPRFAGAIGEHEESDRDADNHADQQRHRRSADTDERRGERRDERRDDYERQCECRGRTAAGAVAADGGV